MTAKEFLENKGWSYDDEMLVALVYDYMEAYLEEYLSKKRQNAVEAIKLEKVIAVQDGDSHWYVIPAWMQNEFYMLSELGEQEDDYTEFEETFDKYRTNGDLNLVELWADIK